MSEQKTRDDERATSPKRLLAVKMADGEKTTTKAADSAEKKERISVDKSKVSRSDLK